MLKCCIDKSLEEGKKMEFIDVVKARRSCRKYTTELVPAVVIERALDAALLAPNSSNLQLWQFYWVNSPEKKAALAKACLGQSAAATAQELIVVVADWSFWKTNNKLMIEQLRKTSTNPDVTKYYEKLIPFVYTYGPLNLIGYAKSAMTASKAWILPK
jgi:nitroreductase